MIDPKYLRQQPEWVAANLKKRGFTLDIAFIQSNEEQRKQLQTEVQSLQNERNLRSKEIGSLKSKGQDISSLTESMTSIGLQLAKAEEALVALQTKLDDYYATLPNLLDESVPEGLDEDHNVTVRHVGQPKTFSFTPKDHIDIGEQLGQMDFESAAKLSGARFVVMCGEFVELHRALIHFMTDLHVREHGYLEYYVPYMVRRNILYGTGQLPKFADDNYHLCGEEDMWLIPTAEVPLTNLMADKIVSADELPLRICAHTPCFRQEAGSYGKDMRGMIRNHQFEKVELVHIVRPETSLDALETLTAHAEEVLKRLDLPYRVILKCGGDTGFSAAKTYDLEVWLPSQNCYREISSCSTCADFQARRMLARFKLGNDKPQWVHTLNGSGVAVGRALIAVVENYQNENGTVTIPKVLQPYMHGKKEIQFRAK